MVVATRVPPKADLSWEMLRDAIGDYLGRLDCHGAERGWFVDQVAFGTGEPPEQVGVALAVVISAGGARSGYGDNGVSVVWPKDGAP